MNIRTLPLVVAVLSLPCMAAAEQEDARQAEDLDEVVVLGRLLSTGLTQIQIEREMLVDTAVVLKEIPGADVNSNGPITGIAQYRGMYGDRIAVAIDHLGVVSGGPNAMDTPLSYVSPMITEEFSVTRGIASVSAAAESIGGHISTRLSRGVFSGGDDPVSGFVGSRYNDNGNVSTTAGRFTLASASHKLSLIGEYDTGNNLVTPRGDIRPSQLDRTRYDVSYAFDDAATSILLFAGRLDTEDTGTAALPMDIRFIETDLAGVQLSQDLTERWSVQARVARSEVSHLMDNFTLRDAPMPTMYRQNLASGDGTQFSLQARHTLGNSEILLGFDGVNAQHDALITNPNNAMFRVQNFSDVKRDVSSLFAQWRKDIGGADVELGVRGKRVSTIAGEVSASGMMGMMGDNVAQLANDFNASQRALEFDSADVVFKYLRRLDDTAEWRIELGSKTRAPSYQELYLWLPLQATAGLADGRSYVGGLDLREERSNEITIGFSKALPRLSLSPQVFYRSVDGYIQGIPSTSMVANRVSQMMSGAPALEFANVDAKIWGADIAWKLDLADRWYLDGIATYVRGERTDEADNLYRLAPPSASLGLTWAGDALSVNAEVVAYARQSKVSSFNDEQETDGYQLLNASLVWNPSDAIRFEAQVNNIANTTYQDHVAGINRANGSDIAVGDRLYGSERSLSLGVIVSY